MSTSITPPPELTTQQQIDQLQAEIAELKAQKIARAPWPAWQAVKMWAASKGGWAHIAVLTYAGAVALIAGVPQVHALYIEAWAHMPKWAVDVLSAIGPIYLFYKSPKPSTPTSEGA